MPLETDKSNGFKLGLNEEIGTGLYLSRFSRTVPLWSDGRNIQFTEIGVAKLPGSQTLVSTNNNEPIRGLLQEEAEESLRVYFGDLSTLYRYTAKTDLLETLGTGYTLSESSGGSEWDSGSSVWDSGNSTWDSGLVQPNQWSLVNYGAFVLATNGVDFPQIYKGTSFSDLVGTDLGPNGTVEIFVNRGPHVLGFNTNVSPKEFIWCDADNVDDWVAAPDNLAGQLEIRELKTKIIAAVPLGSRIAVYGEDQMFVVNYLANDLVFGYQPAINGIGAVNKNAVVPVGRNNYGLSSQGFFVTDGQTFKYIDEPMVRDWFRNNHNAAQIGKVAAFHDEELSQIRWYFPSPESLTNDTCLSFNYERNTWSIILGTRSAGDERRVAGGPITGSEEGSILLEGSPRANNDSSPVVAYVRSKAIDLGNADLVKELDSIRMGFVGNNLQYRIGWSETEDGTIHWGGYRYMETGFPFHNLRTSGRWLHIEIYSDDINTSWELSSMELIGRSEGTR
jgi:hypothetical protein